MRTWRNCVFVALMIAVSAAGTVRVGADDPTSCEPDQEYPPTECSWSYAGSSCSENCTNLCSDWYEDSVGQQTGCTTGGGTVIQACFCYLEPPR